MPTSDIREQLKNTRPITEERVRPRDRDRITSGNAQNLFEQRMKAPTMPGT